MDVKENRNQAKNIDKDWKLIFNSSRTKTTRKPPLKSIVKPRDNKGNLRRKWCTVKTCKYHGGKGLICRKTHLKNHGEHFHLGFPFFKAIKAVLEEDQTGWSPCVGCKNLVGFTNDNELCLICSPVEEKSTTIEAVANQRELQNWSAEYEIIAFKNLHCIKDNLKELVKPFP